MKKVLLIASILTVAVISTACINNLAVQDLNNKAQAYAEKGDYTQAIERLKSSIDLDPSVFETHYNLGVALISAHEYKEAQEALKNALKLKPDYADAYYSLAVAEEDFSIDLAKGALTLDENGAVVKVDDETLMKQEKITLSEPVQKMINDLLADAVSNYNLYLSKGVNLNDEDEVKQKIQKLLEEQEQNQNNNKG